VEGDARAAAGEKRRRLPRPLGGLLKVGAVLFVVELLVLPQLAGARRSLELLGGVDVRLLAAGLVLQLLAIASYAQLTRALLPPETRPGLLDMGRIGLSTQAVGNVVPGGQAAGGALGYKLLRDHGVDGSDAAFALVAQGVGSAVVLNTMLWVALVISIPLRGFHPVYGTAALLGAVLIAGFAVLVALLIRAEDRARRMICRLARPVPRLDPDAAARGLARVAERVQAFAAEPALVRRAVGWAAVNWLLDAASLWVFLAAFGQVVGPDALFVAFGLANVLRAVPITPGGLGVVEAVLTSTLVGFGVPRGEAILAVVAYRLAQYWLPIPVGAAAYLSLRLVPPGQRARALADLADESRREGETLAEWAARTGFPGPSDDGPHRAPRGPDPA
jgi:putative heme transporter